MCLLQLASALSAGEPSLVKLVVTEGKDIRFAHLTSRNGLSPSQIRDILQDNQGFIWFNTQAFLNRYDGYHFKSYRRDPAHPNYPPGTVRPDGSGAFVNRRWTEYTGLSAEDTAGTGWRAAVDPEDRESYWENWRASLAAGEPFEDEARFCCAADGEYRWFLARGVPLRDKPGRVVRWYGILTDIEDRKRIEEERERLRELATQLAHINRVSVMGELVSIAHEVNQPLSGVVSNGSACLRWLAGNTPNVEEVREAVRDIVRDGKRAGNVIAPIRALTKRTAPPREKLDLNQTVQEVLALVGD